MHRRPLNELLRRYAAAHAENGRWSPGSRRSSTAIPTACCAVVSKPHHRVGVDRRCRRPLPADAPSQARQVAAARGHVDGETEVQRAALREAQEESGMQAFTSSAPWLMRCRLPLDLDVHPIPPRGQEPEHLHWDVRFLLQALPGQQLVISAESNQLRWFTAASFWR